METCVTICDADSRWDLEGRLRKLSPGLWDDLEGCDGEGGGREVQEGRNMGKPMADSCRCLAGTHTIVQSGYRSMKNTQIQL